MVAAIRKTGRVAVALQLNTGVVKSFDTFSLQLTTVLKENWNRDIGGVIAFLCTEEARWINAQRIEASGGMML